MVNSIDFSTSLLFKISFLEIFLFPLFLMALSRIPYFKGKNAQQFLYSSLLSFINYIILIFVIQLNYPDNHEDLICSLLAYFSAMIIYLEVWALMSRGYTLGLLLTVYNSKQSIDIKLLANSYRGGEGLEWIIHHRLSGLIGAKLIKNQGGTLSLTPIGIGIAKLYQSSIKILGLDYTG